MKTQVNFIGTGWAIPTPSRSATSILISDKELIKNNILFDCGGDVAKGFTHNDISLDSIDSVFISHGHTDHISGIPGLLHSMHLYGRDKDLYIYSLESVISKISSIIEAFDFDISFDVFLNEIEGSGNIDTFNVEYTEVDHQTPALAFRFSEITFSGDTAPCSDLYDIGFKSELIIHEATLPPNEESKAHRLGHSTPLDALDTAHETNSRNLAIIHTNPEYDIDRFVKHTTFELGSLFAPKDYDTINFG